MPFSVKRLEAWNRRIHYYLGLYFLFFLWLFALTGLMLNHQQWFRDLYERRESSSERSIESPLGQTRLEHTRDVMRQLGLRGEIDWPVSQSVGHLDFSVARPNGAAQVRVDLNAKRASVKEFKNGGWHAFQIFHTFMTCPGKLVRRNSHEAICDLSFEPIFPSCSRLTWLT